MKISQCYRYHSFGILIAFLLIVPSLSFAEGDYLIQPGDQLEILTWNEPLFSREVLVRSDGRISFPLLNDIQASERTPVEVKAEIQEKLKAFIGSPSVTVSVKISIPKKIYVLGEVKNTGAYDFKQNMSILQAFAVAGGFTEWASKDEIVLLRKKNGQDNMIRVDYKQIVKGKDLAQNVYLQPDDIIIVP
jgi:polysaccharide biosynthesis/export protein